MPHILETGRQKPERPAIFTRYTDSVVDHGASLVRPAASHWFDYEGDLALVIAKAGRHIPASEGFDHIAGYACCDDGPIRDFQDHSTQFWPGNNFERSGAFGPWLATPDVIGDINRQTLTTRVNGNIEQQAPIGDLAIGIPDLVAYASTVMTLNPGDVIATGTPGGVGTYRDPQLFLEPGIARHVHDWCRSASDIPLMPRGPRFYCRLLQILVSQRESVFMGLTRWMSKWACAYWSSKTTNSCGARSNANCAGLGAS